MPVPINGKSYPNHKAAVAALKKEGKIEDPDAYVATIERNMQETIADDVTRRIQMLQRWGVSDNEINYIIHDEFPDWLVQDRFPSLIEDPRVEKPYSSTPDPRGDGEVLDDNGQQNIIDYMNKDNFMRKPLGTNQAGLIVLNNEPRHFGIGFEEGAERPGIQLKNGTGQGSVGETVSIPGGLVKKEIGCPCNNKIKLVESVLNKCGNCKMFVKGGRCVLVKGEIDPIEHVCDYHESGPIDSYKYKQPTITKFQANYRDIFSKVQEAFSEQDHPRAPAGSAEGGQFVSKDSTQTPGGPEQNNEEEQPALSPGVMGYEPEKMSDEEIEKELRFNQNSIKNYRQGSPIWIQMSGKIGALKAEKEKRAGGVAGDKVPTPEPQTPEKKVEQQDKPHKPGKEIYQGLNQEDTPEGRESRQKVFGPFEGDNESVASLREEINRRNDQIRFWTEMKASSQGDEKKKEWQDKIDKVKGELPGFIDQKKYFEQKLGDKLEPVQVQDALHHIRRLQDQQNLTRNGTKKYTELEFSKAYYNRLIDNYRRGKHEGHNEVEFAELQKKNREESNKRYAEQKKIADEKKAKKNQKTGEKVSTAHKTLQSLGIDTNTIDVGGPGLTEKITAMKPTEELYSKAISGDSAAHKELIQKNINYNKAKAAQLQILLQKHEESNMGYHGYTYKKYQEELENYKFRADNEVQDHDIHGVHIYSDVQGDKERMKSHMEKLKDIPPITKQVMQHVELRANGSRTKFQAAGGRKVTAAGVWHQPKKTAVIYYEGKKWSHLTGQDNTTPDHEYAHATWDAVDKIYKNPDIKNIAFKTAFEKFTNVAEETGKQTYGMGMRFSLDPYTDSYYKTFDQRRHTETHSKLREFEVNGTLDKLERDAQYAIDYRDDYNKDPSKYESKGMSQPDIMANDKYGFKAGTAEAEDMLKLIKSYRELRKQEHEYRE